MKSSGGVFTTFDEVKKRLNVMASVSEEYMEYSQLTQLNDFTDMTFEQLADFFESEPEGMFNE